MPLYHSVDLTGCALDGVRLNLCMREGNITLILALLNFVLRYRRGGSHVQCPCQISTIVGQSPSSQQPWRCNHANITTQTRSGRQCVRSNAQLSLSITSAGLVLCTPPQSLRMLDHPSPPRRAVDSPPRMHAQKPINRKRKESACPRTRASGYVYALNVVVLLSRQPLPSSNPCTPKS